MGSQAESWFVLTVPGGKYLFPNYHALIRSSGQCNFEHATTLHQPPPPPTPPSCCVHFDLYISNFGLPPQAGAQCYIEILFAVRIYHISFGFIRKPKDEKNSPKVEKPFLKKAPRVKIDPIFLPTG